MPNIPGAQNALPGVFTDFVTQSRGVNVPGGSRVAAMLGEGSTNETLIATALGGGKDGLNATFTSTSGADGRHFQLLNFPLISNRTTVFKNGIPLKGLEGTIPASGVFSDHYDYLLDITLGRILLQSAHLLDQGGSFYLPLSTNVGVGVINNLLLKDVNAPPETWTIRCVKVQRDPMNQPIAGTASFLAFGSVSGAKLDANGNPIVWLANNNVVSNGIISFSIQETASTPFREGDGFTIIVASGVLVRGDSLTVNEIPLANLNDPVLLQGLGAVVNRHGLPSLDNNLALGAQLFFANAASSLITVQAAPSLPRRTSYILDEIDSLSPDDDEFILPLPFNVVPDFNSNIHFFVTNLTTNVETQILPNKLTYYTLDTTGFPTTHQFIQDNTPAPGGFSYFYTVKQSLEDLNFGEDGYFARLPAFHNQAIFSSSVAFDSTYVDKVLKVIDSTNSGNFGLFHITAVSNGKLHVIADGTTISGSLSYNPSYLSDFINESPITFEVINPLTGTAITGGSATDGILVKVGPNTGQATLTSATVDFSTISNIFNYQLQINGSTTASASAPVGNNGAYDIIAVAANQITIRKTVVSESNLEYEVLDPAGLSNYVVINKNVVPNGYRLRVTLVDSRDASFFDAGWVNALATLEKIECDIVVPLPKQTISVIFQNALAHCITMSNIKNRKERVLFIGAIDGLTPDNVTGVAPAAVEDIGVLEGIQGETVTDILSGNIEDLSNYSVPDAFGSVIRTVFFYPDQIVVTAGTQNLLVDGFYMAAAGAGYEVADTNLANPITNKVFSGFTILRNKQFSPSVLEQLASAGITTLQPVAGGGRVVWGLTTSQSGFVVDQEISVIFIRDRVAKVLRAGFQGFIGTPQTADTGAILNTRAVIILNSLVSQGLLVSYKDLAVVQDDVNPTQYDIVVGIKVSLPLDFVYIKVTLD